ncbi:Methylglutaconyl-CoA hydratase, mitochondrial [Smittium culicis]|uniref:Methylglutaconyl-CoA hydratase, mitochondrial n=2 Tax=Smittium culicis TaxID=133412 RepID=A0A1R1YRH1_9FUNG|nr:Methylglutaconyl-CoA hydratase, mitochondrial [Smittium culicis]
MRYGASVTSTEKECYISIPKPGVATINLNRPKSKNALSKNLLNELRHSINQIRLDPDVRVVILNSNVDKVFCAGADLKERITMTPLEVSQFLNSLKETFIELENLPVATIAALDGAALGGGLELALCCDLRVSGEKTILGLVETSLGIIPGAGGTQRITNLVGPSKAKELIYTSARLNAQQAHVYGIINDYTSNSENSISRSGFSASSSNARKSFETGYELALEWAERISQMGPLAVKMAKRAINMGFESDIKTGLEIEQLCYDRVINTEDRLEGLRAFKEKRAPVYKGK